METTDIVTWSDSTQGLDSVELPGRPLTPEQIAYYVIGTLGCLGNVFVIVVILNSSFMHNVVTTTFILNQSVVDALAGLVLILNYLPQNDLKVTFSQTVWDNFVCRVWLCKSVLWSMFMISSLNLMALTLERLLAVWKPLWHKTSFTQKKQGLILAFIWIFGPVIPITHGLVDAKITGSGRCYRYGMGGTAGNVIGFIQILFEFGLPVLVFILTYTTIAILLRMRSKIMVQHNAIINMAAGKKIHGGKSVIKTMVVVCLCFVICWASNEVYYFMYLTGHPYDFKNTYYMISVNIVFVNCCCNPFVYILKYKDFQRSLRKLFGCQTRVEDVSSRDNRSTAQEKV